MLLAGDKTIELRRYRVPDSYLGALRLITLATHACIATRACAAHIERGCAHSCKDSRSTHPPPGVPVLLLATPDGNEGVSMLPDLLPPGHPGVRVVRDDTAALLPRPLAAAGVLCAVSCRAARRRQRLSADVPPHLSATLHVRPPQAGSIVFASQKRYASFEEFAADEGRHRVPATGTPYGWTPGGGAGATVCARLLHARACVDW